MSANITTSAGASIVAMARGVRLSHPPMRSALAAIPVITYSSMLLTSLAQAPPPVGPGCVWGQFHQKQGRTV